MSDEAIKFKNSVFFVVSFTLLLWGVKALEWAVALDFGFLGILPRTLSGTMGIITAPLIHGDALHLISNTFPLLLLGVSVFYFYDKIALEVFAWIYFLSGFWVWMAARDAYHIGASGLIYGLVAFLFFSGLFRRDTKSLTISLIVIFLYGGMLQGLFPTDGRISWESHLLGAMAGAFCAFFYRKVRLSIKQKGSQDQYAVQTSSLFPLMKGEEEEQEVPKRKYSDFEDAINTYPLSFTNKTGAPLIAHKSFPDRIKAEKPELLQLYIYKKVAAQPSQPRKKQVPLNSYGYSIPAPLPEWKKSTTTN